MWSILCNKDEELVFIIDESGKSLCELSSFKKLTKVFFDTLEPQPWQYILMSVGFSNSKFLKDIFEL